MTYRASTAGQLEVLIQKLQELECIDKALDEHLCRTCDVKALAAVAGFLSPRVVEDGPGAISYIEADDFEEIPF